MRFAMGIAKRAALVVESALHRGRQQAGDFGRGLGFPGGIRSPSAWAVAWA